LLYLSSRYDPTSVATSVFIAMFASYVALDLAKRVRSTDRLLAIGWLLGGSATMGTGIWSMHFVGMLAFRLPIEVGYSYATTGLSWLAAVAVSSIALWTASRATVSKLRLTVSALAMGCGISAMHYTGMAALVMAPGIVWDYGRVALSVAIAAGASAVALMIFFWLRHFTGRRAIELQFAAAGVMGLAISGMHYTGMSAASFPLGAVCVSADQLSGDGLLLLVGICALAVLTLTMCTSILDSRTQVHTARLARSLQTANDELQRIAFRDPLTGLPNRMLLDDRLNQAAARCERDGGRAALLFIDLDGFKPINDTFGHPVGDAVLKEVAQRLLLQSRDSDTVARSGGDEFVLLLESRVDATAAAQVAQRIVEAISAPYLIGGREAALSCSIGIVLMPDHGPRDKLIAHADAAMYTAKRNGGAGHAFFEPHMGHAAAEQMELQRDLRRAVERGQMSLHYQPKVDALSGAVTGLEALLRWQHPTQGPVSPALVVPIAERFGLINALGNWVIDEVCRQQQAWREQGLRLRVALNLSVHQLRQDDLVSRIEQALHRHGIEPDMLMLEITETVAMEDAAATQRIFDGLAELGVQLSIDDFGTGYSSLAYLRKLPARQLKVDRSFIADLGTDKDARAVVDAVLRLARALDLRVVAEGVETAAQRDILLELGCDELQGFLLARPMPAADVLMLARSQHVQGRPPLDFGPSTFLTEDQQLA
jgi:diguanylate cyclase (GGDEF)-like protein